MPVGRPFTAQGKQTAGPEGLGVGLGDRGVTAVNAPDPCVVLPGNRGRGPPTHALWLRGQVSDDERHLGRVSVTGGV